MNLQKRLTDKRIKKVAVFDTETAPYYETVKPYVKRGYQKPFSRDYVHGTLHELKNAQGQVIYEWETTQRQLQLIFDFGWTVADKQGNIFIKRNFLVKEIFTNMGLMKHAHYFSKYPLYLEMLSKGDISLLPWIDIITQFEKDLLNYNINETYAFNIAFDKRAVMHTHKIITGRPLLFWDAHGLKSNCLWGMVAETTMQTRSFIKTAIKEKWLSPKGNILTNAQTAYRYYTQCYDFQESHTALDDAIIETEIMARCFKTHKKMSFGIIEQPWRLVRKKAIELGMLKDE